MSFNKLDSRHILERTAANCGLTLTTDDLEALSVALVDGSRSLARCKDSTAAFLIGFGTRLNHADTRGRALDMFDRLRSEFLEQAESTAYERFRAETDASLRHELMSEVRKELREELTPVVCKELREQLAPAVEDQLEQEVEARLERVHLPGFRKRLREELTPIIRAELEAELGAQKEAAQ